MYKILKAEKLADKIYLMDVEAPRVAKACQPGEFVIVKMDDRGERIPLTICDFDREKGTITIVFQIVGASTERMSYLQTGDSFEDVVGPLGRPSEFTEEELEEYPHLNAAQGEDDTGVIVSFNSEAEEITDSMMIPQGTKTIAINPLNWKTDSTPADKSLNLGACFTDYSGEIKEEIPELTGAYLDETRGALKVTDVTPEEYPAGLDLFEDGIYHLYDYQFFYRNLQENVKTRLDAYYQ